MNAKKIAALAQQGAAQAPSRDAAGFAAAVDAAYPLPDSPHASVIQRATDNRAAMWRGINAARTILDQQSASQATSIDADLDYLLEYIPNHAVRAECKRKVDDLRAALARAPLPAQGGGFTDAQIIAALHANGIDTYPSKYGFDAVQVSATSVPALRKVIESLAAPARAPLPAQGADVDAILAARAEGRAEAVEILTGLCPETGIDDYVGWSKPVAPEDEGSSYWREDKLRELFMCDDKLHNLFDRAEAMYWKARCEKDQAEMEMRMVERAPFYKPLHDFLSKHQAHDLMADLKLYAAPAQAPLPAQLGEPVARVDEGDDGLFVEILYGKYGSQLKRGDKLYLPAPAQALLPDQGEAQPVARVTKEPGCLDLESLIDDDKWPEGVTDLYAAPAQAPLPAQGAAQEPFGMYVERDDGTSEFQRTGKAFQPTAYGYKVWTLYATPAKAGDAQNAAPWSKEPPTEQADYWNWDGDPDHAPMIYHVLWSGTAKKCFVSIGQYGIEQAIWCDEFGGYWMKIEQPSVHTAMSASQGTKGDAT